LVAYNRRSFRLGLGLSKLQKNVILYNGAAGRVKIEKEYMDEYVSISEAEENVLKQKLRYQWLNLVGQNNSSFIGL
jgi:hypothetical protein